MDGDLTTPVLLDRIARLETLVGRISADLGSLRSAIARQARSRQETPGARAGGGRRAGSAAAAERHALVAGGLAGAVARGEAARVQWVHEGLVVPSERLAQAWGLKRQALAAAAGRGEVFAVKVGNRLYYPQVFLGMDRQGVAAICRALGDLGASEKLVFWLREHGALAGSSVAVALESGTADLTKVVRLAAAWARERGASRGAAVA